MPSRKQFLQSKGNNLRQIAQSALTKPKNHWRLPVAISIVVFAFSTCVKQKHQRRGTLEPAERSSKSQSFRHSFSPKPFENILEASFASFIRRHPAEFRYCPTPDCDQVYRVSSPGKLPSTFTCARCFTPTYTACHDSHLGISCAKHKGNGSEDIEELIKAKEDLGAKDCPKCTTAIQKAEGCNHMTCLACGTHICWVCMATFTEDSDCYRHMGQLHGGIYIV
ncbi:hypothetical protein LB504_010014 [Fusarium proliferatum]|nr:hypothetical protein LB504_010014 [Fusarium proliferatum]